MDDEEQGNLFSLADFKKAKEAEAMVAETTQSAEVRKPAFPMNDYIVTDVNNREWYATGFLVWTDTHVGVMKSTDMGAIPALLLHNNVVIAVELYEDDEDSED